MAYEDATGSGSVLSPAVPAILAREHTSFWFIT